MSRYYGDFRAGQVVRCRFNTVNASGAPTTLTAGAVVVSRDGADVTPSGGVTLTTDAGGVTGRHAVVIDLSVDPSVFTAGSDYAVRLSGSSAVGAVSVAGAVVGEWSVANRSVAVDSAGKVPATLAAGDVTGNLAADLQTIKTQAVTATAGVTFPAAVGTSTYAGGAVAGVTAPVTVVNLEALTGTVVSATTTSVVIFATVPASGQTANAYAPPGPARYLTFTSGPNAGLVVAITASSYSGGNLTLGFAATTGVVAASAGDTVQID